MLSFLLLIIQINSVPIICRDCQGIDFRSFLNSHQLRTISQKINNIDNALLSISTPGPIDSHDQTWYFEIDFPTLYLYKTDNVLPNFINTISIDPFLLSYRFIINSIFDSNLIPILSKNVSHKTQYFLTFQNIPNSNMRLLTDIEQFNSTIDIIANPPSKITLQAKYNKSFLLSSNFFTKLKYKLIFETIFNQNCFIELTAIISKYLIVFFLIILSCRVFALLLPVSLRFKNIESQYAFIHNKSLLISSLPRKIRDFNLFLSVIRKSIKLSYDTKEEQFFICDCGEYSFNVHIFNLAHNYVLILLLRESNGIENYYDSNVTSAGNCIITLDDGLEQQTPKAELKFIKGQHAEINVPFNVWDSKCNIKISAQNVSYPLTPSSNMISNMSALHILLIDVGYSIPPTIAGMQSFIDEIIYRLDFAGIAVFRGNRRIFFKTVDKELESDMNSFLEHIKEIKSPFDIFVTNTKNYRLCGNHFETGSSDFQLIVATRSSSMVLRSIERMYHFFISLFISGHPSLLPTDDILMSWKRIEQCLDKSNVLALVTCLGNSLKIIQSKGKIGGKKVDQEFFDYLIEQINENPKCFISKQLNLPLNFISNPTKDLQLRQNVVTVTVNNQIVQLLFSQRTYFDETISGNKTIFFLQDVSKFFPSYHLPDRKTLKLNFIANSFGFVKVNSDLNLENGDSIVTELGYKQPIQKLEEILYEKDSECFKQKHNGKFAFRLLSSLGHPSWFIALPIKNDSYYIFSSFEMRKMRALAPSEADSLLIDHSNEQIVFASIDTVNYIVNVFINNEWLCYYCDPVNGSLRLDLLLTLLPKEDQVIFMECLQNIETGRSIEEHFYVRVDTHTTSTTIKPHFLSTANINSSSNPTFHLNKPNPVSTSADNIIDNNGNLYSTSKAFHPKIVSPRGSHSPVPYSPKSTHFSSMSSPSPSPSHPSTYSVCLFLTPNNQITLYMCDRTRKIAEDANRDKIVEYIESAFSNSFALQFVFDDALLPDRFYNAVPSSRTPMILNWSNIHKQCLKEYQKVVTQRLRIAINNNLPFSSFIPLMFDREIAFYVRAMMKDNALRGIAFDFTFLFSIIKRLQEDKAQIMTEQAIEAQSENSKLELTKDIISTFHDLNEIFSVLFQNKDVAKLIQFLVQQFDSFL